MDSTALGHLFLPGLSSAALRGGATAAAARSCWDLPLIPHIPAPFLPFLSITPSSLSPLPPQGPVSAPCGGTGAGARCVTVCSPSYEELWFGVISIMAILSHFEREEKTVCL